jgi:hypothetical protein
LSCAPTARKCQNGILNACLEVFNHAIHDSELNLGTALNFLDGNPAIERLLLAEEE